jgi:acetyltransferase-like isoleucine patch superfamily enzyme
MSNMYGVTFGEDVLVHENCYFSRPDIVVLGNHVAIDYGFYSTTAINLGDYVHISSHVSVIGGRHSTLNVEDFGFISTGCRVVCGSDNMLGDGIVGPFIPKKYEDSKTTASINIGKFAGVGAGSVLLPGAELAEGAILGANSMLKEKTEPWTIYVGSPARPISLRPRDKILANAAEMGYL